jgi:hypothetical protein
MSITATTLTRVTGAAAVAAGVLFIGVQIGHPHLDVASVDTTEMLVRDSVKVLMAALALVGITGMYLRQVRQTGVLGLLGYALLSTGYLTILCTSFVAAYVLPALAGRDPRYVDQVLFAATSGNGGTDTGLDIGLLHTAFTVQGIGYLAGGLLFGIALYRARVLARWAAALLAISGLVTVALAAMPDAFYRLLAFPNGIALIGLGWSLWSGTRTDSTCLQAAGTDGSDRTDHSTVGAR